MHMYVLVMLPINLSCFLKCQCSNAFTVHYVQSMVPYLMDMAKLQWSPWWGAGGGAGWGLLMMMGMPIGKLEFIS